MKSKLLFTIAFVTLLITSKTNFAQVPNLGMASTFSIFTAVGAVGNIGSTSVYGDLGTNVGAFTGFPPGTVYGQIHIADPTTVQAAIDLAIAYGNMSSLTCGAVIGTTLGSGQVLTPNIYCLGAASSMNGVLSLDAQGDPSAIFIFKINGAFSIASFSSIILLNSASASNIFWQVNGQFELGNSSIFVGSILANGAIHLLNGSSLIGRGLSVAGEITMSANTVNCLPGDAGTISGTNAVCQGQSSLAYSVPIISNSTTYTWSLPPGASLQSGGNTNNILVNFNSTATSGNLNVYGTNSCGNGNISPNYAILVNPLPVVYLLSGGGSYCIGGGGVNVELSGSQTGVDYQLQINGINTGPGMAGTNGVITFPPQTVAGTYSVIATNPLTSCTISMQGNVTVSILPIPLTSAIYHQ